jgi:hypothetical protein
MYSEDSEPDSVNTSIDASTTTSEADNDSSVNAPINTFTKRGYRSGVWDYFEKVEWGKEGMKKTAKCIISNCRHAVFSCGNTGTTRPLWRHIEKAHRTVYITTEEYQRKKTKTQTECGKIEMFIVSFTYQCCFRFRD